jgi:hypothetical protein
MFCEKHQCEYPEGAKCQGIHCASPECQCPACVAYQETLAKVGRPATLGTATFANVTGWSTKAQFKQWNERK